MSEVLYPDGYATPPRMVPIETVFARASVMMLHPEYQKRWRGLMIAGEGRLGIGGAGRSSEQQKRVFLERHDKVASGGCCYYMGQRYQLKAGSAHAAPPGRSFHEDVVYGHAAAVDAIGDLKWAALHCEEYGLEQATWGGEVWHFQFTEFPHSVSSWLKAGSPPPTKWVLPGTPPPSGGTDMAAIMPTIRKGSTGAYVERMQHLLAAAGFMDPANTANYDGVWGNGTDGAKSRFNTAFGLPASPTDCEAKSWESLLTGRKW